MLARVMQDPGIDRPTAVVTPIISFELAGMNYDPDRKLKTIGRSTVANTVNKSYFRYLYNPVPYNISYKAYVFAKTAADACNIVEQIAPFFTPDWTTTVILIPEMENLSMDIPVVLHGTTPEDHYYGELGDRRLIVWTLDFTLKGYFWGPVKDGAIIKFANVSFRVVKTPDNEIANAVGNTGTSERVTVQPGLTADGKPTSNIQLTIPYTLIDINDDYGYITTITDYAPPEPP